MRVAADGTKTRELAFAYDPGPGAYGAVPLDLGSSGERTFLIPCGTGIRGAAAANVVVGGEDDSIRGIGPQPGIAGVDLIDAGPFPRG